MISGIIWVISISYDWWMVSMETHILLFKTGEDWVCINIFAFKYLLAPTFV